MPISAFAQLVLTKRPVRVKTLGLSVGLVIIEMLSQGACNVNKCHCRPQNRTVPCPKNGYCPTGCEEGFYGPGCQVGNVAYRKEAQQSSTFTVATGRYYGAPLAVDGYYINDSSVDWAPNCSHTNSNTTTNWWQVILGATNTYTIYNVTIINRADSTASRLRDFKIYVSDLVEIYPKGNWKLCAQHWNEAPFVTNFTCTQIFVGRSVAIVQNNMNSSSYLALCEVIVWGYENFECPEGFAGPACLSRSCDSDECTNGGRCGPLGTCIFYICPGNEHLPPDCWITLPSFASYQWKKQVDVSKITITGTPSATTALTDLNATAFVVNVSVGSLKIDYSARMKYDFSPPRSARVFIDGEQGLTYNFTMIPRHCFKDKVCPDGINCFAPPVCVDGVNSEWISVTTAGGGIANIWKTIGLNSATVVFWSLYYFPQL